MVRTAVCAGGTGDSRRARACINDDVEFLVIFSYVDRKEVVAESIVAEDLYGPVFQTAFIYIVYEKPFFCLLG